jgi:hypothetical protein
LRGSSVLSGVDDAVLLEVERRMWSITVANGESILREGDVADSSHLVADGTAAVTPHRPQWWTVTLAVLGPGDSTGERALVGSGNRDWRPSAHWRASSCLPWARPTVRLGWRRGAPPMLAVLAAAAVVLLLLHGIWDWRGLPAPWNFVWLLLVGVASALTVRWILHRAATEEA